VLNALAAVTDRLGLAATVNATFNEPFEWPAGSPPSTGSAKAAPPGTW